MNKLLKRAIKGLNESVRQQQKIVANLRDMDEKGRLIQADVMFQADNLEYWTRQTAYWIAQIEIHGGGTGTD